MAYTPEQKQDIFDRICARITKGDSLRKVFREEKDLFDIGMFYDLIKEDESKYQQYARATAVRADFMFDETLEIADDGQKDTIVTDEGIQQNQENIQRSRLRVDTRKWILSKMNPKKYGERIDQYIDHTTLGEKLPAPIIHTSGTPPLANSENDIELT